MASYSINRSKAITLQELRPFMAMLKQVLHCSFDLTKKFRVLLLPSLKSDAFNSNSRLLPQRLTLPSAGEAHGGDVDGRVGGKQGIDFRLHVIVGRNDVEEILDDAKVEIKKTTRTFEHR